MKKLLFFALSLSVLAACSHKKADSNAMNNDSILSDSVVEIIGEWQEVPVPGQPAATPAPGMKLNQDNSAQATNVDTTLATTSIYQAWNQQGDTLTLISANAVNPAMKDTVSWQIVSLTGDSLVLNSPAHGVKKFVRKK